MTECPVSLFAWAIAAIFYVLGVGHGYLPTQDACAPTARAAAEEERESLRRSPLVLLPSE